MEYAPNIPGYVLQSDSPYVKEGIDADTKIEFVYAKEITITVRLVDLDESDLSKKDITSKASGFITSYTIISGESLEVAAPEIPGYTLVNANPQKLGSFTEDKTVDIGYNREKLTINVRPVDLNNSNEDITSKASRFTITYSLP